MQTPFMTAQVQMKTTRQHHHKFSAAGVLIKQVGSHMPWKHPAVKYHQSQQQV